MLKPFIYISHQLEGIGVWTFEYKGHAEHAFLLDVLDTSEELGLSLDYTNDDMLEEAWSNHGYELLATSPITMYLRETR